MSEYGTQGQLSISTRTLLLIILAMLLGQAASARTLYPRAAWVADIPPGQHSVEAIVTIVDAHTLQVEHFTYDGTAPLVYFYLGASNDDGAFQNGLQLDPLLDRPYDDESLVLNLPEGETLDGYNAISVWCAEFSINFSSAAFAAPASMYQRAGWIADIPLGEHQVEGQATIITDRIIQIEHFTYDGLASFVYFYLGTVDDYFAFLHGLRLHPLLDRPYADESLVLLLPEDATLDGYGAISVWCAAFAVNFSSASFIVPEPQAVGVIGAGPGAGFLQPPVPNPLVTSSSISFQLGRDSPALLTVHDLRGRRVASLAGGRLGAGVHRAEWDGLDRDGRRVSPGVYFVRLAVGGDELVRRIVVLN